MRRHVPALPKLSGRALAAVLLLMTAVCVCAGVGLRLSLTDYNSRPDLLGELPFSAHVATEKRLTLYPNEEVERALAQESEQGYDFTLAEASLAVGMAPQDIEPVAPLVITGRFTGERTYVYDAFRCQIEVTSVVKGDGVSVGALVEVYEGYEVVEPGNLTRAGQFSGDREVVASAASLALFGTNPMREGQEYLLFLEPKRYPDAADPASYGQTYCTLMHPYARVATAARVASSRVLVADGSSGVPEGLSFSEAQGYDLVVESEAAKETYLANCGLVLEAALGEPGREDGV